MIYIRIELWPQGDHTSPQLLHEMSFTNTSREADARYADYSCVLSKAGGFGRDRASIASGMIGLDRIQGMANLSSMLRKPLRILSHFLSRVSGE